MSFCNITSYYLWYNRFMRSNHFSKKRLMASFTNAFNGLRILSGEQSFMLQCAIAVIVIIFAFIFHFSAIKFAILILLIGFVLTLEILNTVLENLLDVLHPKKDSKIGLIKDAAGGVVLFASAVAFVVGLILFISK